MLQQREISARTVILESYTASRWDEGRERGEQHFVYKTGGGFIMYGEGGRFVMYA